MWKGPCHFPRLYGYGGGLGFFSLCTGGVVQFFFCEKGTVFLFLLCMCWGESSGFSGGNMHGAGGPKAVCRLGFGRKLLREIMKHCHPSREKGNLSYADGCDPYN